MHDPRDRERPHVVRREPPHVVCRNSADRRQSVFASARLDRAQVRPNKPLRGLKTLLSSGRWLRRRFVRRAAILGYHSIAEPTWDPFDLCVSPSNLAKHLQLIRERFTPVPLADLVAGLRDGSLPEGAVAVTFDDGYRDNLTVARPLLERYEIPATVFVVSRSVGARLWWDELAAMLDPSRPLPSTLRFSIAGREHEVTVDQADPVRARKQVATAIGQLIMRRSPMHIEEALRSLAATVSEPHPAAERSVLDADELLELDESGLIEVGSHTANHLFLAVLPIEEQRAEVFNSKVDLEAWLGRPVRSLSYPNGSSTGQTRRIVREAGFTCACGSRPDIVWRGSDCFDLARLWPPNEDGKSFADFIGRFL